MLQGINRIKDGCEQQQAIEILTSICEYYVKRFPGPDESDIDPERREPDSLFRDAVRTVTNEIEIITETAGVSDRDAYTWLQIDPAGYKTALEMWQECRRRFVRALEERRRYWQRHP